VAKLVNIEKLSSSSHFDHRCRVKESTIHQVDPDSDTYPKVWIVVPVHTYPKYCDNDSSQQVTTNAINESRTVVAGNNSLQKVTTDAINESRTVVGDNDSLQKVTTNDINESRTVVADNNSLQKVPTDAINESHSVVGVNDSLPLQKVTTNDINESRTVVGDNDSLQKVTTNAINESQTVVQLKRKVKRLQRQLRFEKKKVVQFEQNLNRFLNDDQVRQLKKLNSASARAVKWSKDTIKSSLLIRCATGAKGYTYHGSTLRLTGI